MGISDANRAGVYCGSGITAAVVVAARSAGRHPALFPRFLVAVGSDPARPSLPDRD